MKRHSPGLALKKRPKVIWKWHIDMEVPLYISCNIIAATVKMEPYHSIQLSAHDHPSLRWMTDLHQRTMVAVVVPEEKKRLHSFSQCDRGVLIDV